MQKSFDFVGVDASLFYELVTINSSLHRCKVAMAKYVNAHAIEVSGDRRIRIYNKSDIEFVADNQFGTECVGVKHNASYYYRTDDGRWFFYEC